MDGRDGKDFDLESVRPVITDLVERSVAAIPKPRDGVGLAHIVIDREGCAVVTMTDGSLHSLGKIQGQDGAPGRDGRDLSLNNLQFEMVERELRVLHDDGELIFSTKIPVPLDRGIFSDGKQYELADEVTFAGQVYIATKDNPEGKPGVTQDWRLRSRKGRDGRDGKDGAKGERGPQGPATPVSKH
jgi:hypothetical protein